MLRKKISTTLLILGLVLLNFSNALSQVIPYISTIATDSMIKGYMNPTHHQLDGARISATRLTVHDIIDSAIANATNNYFKRPAFRVQLDISLRNPKETFFDCGVNAYLIHPLEKMKQYLLTVSENNAYTIKKNTLDKNQSNRIMYVDGFPKIFTEDFLSNIKKQVQKNESYFFCRPENQDSSFIIIIKNKSVPNSFLQRKDATEVFPKACSFRIITVKRSGWVVTNSYSMIIETLQDEFDKFSAVNDYFSLAALVRNLLKNTERKHISTIVRFKHNNSGYFVNDFLLENSFYRLSRKFMSITSNTENSVYSYWMHDFVPLDSCPQYYQLFNIKRMLRL